MSDPRVWRRTFIAFVLALATPLAVTAARRPSQASPSGRPASASAQAPTQATTAPRRIVSFVPAVTEMLFAMGAGDRVVGVSSYDRFPAAVRALPQVGGLLDPNVERVLSLRPDLVIVYGTQRDLRAQLDRVNQYEYVHRDLADVTRTMRTVGERIGAGAAGERLATETERQLDAIRQSTTGRPRPRTLLVFGREAGSLRRIQASGGYGFLHDLLELAGGNDVMGDVQRESVEMSSETVLSRAPEVILELHYGRALSPADLTRLTGEWAALPGVPAVRQHRVYVLQGDEFVVPGPRIVEAARGLLTALQTPVTRR